jgi:UDP-N-acetylglucosamine--N-acetylmuramyl-(pentapeptide) pyrophosphoryl-undecaprenol N-acetylglucosamine transferase
MAAVSPGSDESSLRGPASVLLAGGGSAGHVSPLLAVADALRRRDPTIVVTALGTTEGLETRIVPARGYPLLFVPKVPMPRRPTPAWLTLPGALAGAVRAAGAAIDQSAAQVVVGFGGYVCTPAYVAARRRGIPIVIHEQNARAGIANRFGARLTTYVAAAFPGTGLPHVQVVGMPLRTEITQLDRAARRDEAAEYFGLDPARRTILVTGGSLGAQRLNTTFEQRVSRLSSAGVQVLHVSGLGKEFAAAPPVGGAAYVVVPYADRMDLAYAAADLVVARSGASTVCELTAVGLPAVYVPLPVGNGEQRINAEAVLRAGGGLLVDDADLTPQWVDDVLIPLARDDARLATMAAAAASVGQRNADDAMATLVFTAYREREGHR